MAIEVTFVGCGDAFGSGGRFNTCFHVANGERRFLIDCGATSMVALKALGLDPNAIGTILITHFHADHFGGLPFFLLDARFVSKRSSPLTIVGPRGTGAALNQSMESAFHGSSGTTFKFPLEIIELVPGQARTIDGLDVTPQQVVHGPEGGPYLAYRIGVGRRVIAYTGDTEWTDTLIEAGREADLLIAEAYYLDRQVRYHLDLATLERHLPAMQPRRIILTHLSSEMLERVDEVAYEVASDGLTISL